MTEPVAEVRRPYCVGAVKIPYAARDVAHAILTDADDRGFYDIIGGDSPDRDETFPVGANVTYRVELTDAEADLFRAASNCRYVELDVEVRATAGPMSIPATSTLGFMRANFPRNDLWHGRDVKVAVLDGGTTSAVRQYMGWTLVARQLFGPDEPGADEITTEHGCLVAPNCVPPGGQLIDAIVFGDTGGGFGSTTAAAMRWAADQSAQVINFSGSGPNPNSVYPDAFQYLLDRGVQVYVSMGNDSLNQASYPAAYSPTWPNVHSSISFDEVTGARSQFSNYTATASGCAPGSNVASLTPSALPKRWSGTSASSPHMARLCAMGATGGRFTAAQVGAALDANCRDTGQPAAEQGGGAYDLQAALTALGGFSAGATRTNLSPNPAALTTSTGWTGGSSATRVTGLTGLPRVTGFAAQSNVMTPRATATPGTGYALSLSVRSSAVATLNVAIRWYNSSGTLLSTTAAANLEVVAGAPARVGRTGTAPSSTASAALYVTTTAGTITATASLIEAGTVVRPYFDGADTNSAWSGTGGNSTSTRSFPIPTQALRTNLSPNPSLESNATGYTVGTVRAGITATPAIRSNSIPAAFGTVYGSTNITGDGTTSTSVADVELNVPSCPVTAGFSYVFSAHLRHSVEGASVEWSVQWLNSSGGTISTTRSGRTSLLAFLWPRYQYTAAAPSGAVTAAVKLLLSGMSDTAARSFRFDAFHYEQASALGEYFDGSTTGGSWTGTANNSTSTIGTGTGPPPPPTATSPGSLHNIGKGAGLNHFNLGVGKTSAHIDITENELEAGYSLPSGSSGGAAYYLNADKTAVVMVVPLDGARTTTNTKYPRVEYRELAPGGVGDSSTPKAAWDPSDGEHYLTGRTRILKIPPNKPEVVIGQVHDADDDTVMIRLRARTIVEARFGDTVVGNLTTSLAIGTEYQWKICVLNGAVSWYWQDMDTPKFTHPGFGDSTKTQYFKAGNYAQSWGGSPDSIRGNPTDSVSDGPFILELRDLECWHTGYPPPIRNTTVGVPTVSAGEDATADNGTTFARIATEIANGSTISSRRWTIQSGPTGVGTTLDTDAALSWTPTVIGTYVLRYAATNSSGTGYDEVVLTVETVDEGGPGEGEPGQGTRIYPLEYPDGTPYPVIGAGTTVVNVSTAAQLTSALSAAAAGQRILLANGTYSGSFTIQAKNGTATSGISIEAATSGGASFASGSSLVIKGCQHVTVKGLTFPFDVPGDVMAIKGASKWVRITRCTFGPASLGSAGTESGNFIYLGDENTSTDFFRIDHNEFRNKAIKGNCVRVYGNFSSYVGCKYGRIDHNIFRQVKPAVENDKEPIRYGVSTMSRTISNAVIERNYFTDCASEPEITSVKMCRIRVSGNTYYRCAGGVVIRHGTDSIQSDNYIIDGNDTSYVDPRSGSLIGSGGTRFYDADHDILHNYYGNLSGPGNFQRALLLDTGDAEGSSTNLSAHWRIFRAKVDRNVIVNCLTGIVVGDNYSTAPSGVTITNNITAGVSSGTPPITYINNTALVGSTVTGNVNYVTPTAGGFTQDTDGIWRKESYGPRLTYISQSDVGPSGDLDDEDGTGFTGTGGNTGTVAPTVNAGADATALVRTAFVRTASETGAAIATRAWTIQAGPVGVGTSIGTTATLSWTPTVAGAYRLRYTATNSAGSGSDEVGVTVGTGGGPVAPPTFVGSGPGQSGQSTGMEIPPPSGVLAGDFQVAVIQCANAETITSAPPEWRLLDQASVTSPSNRGGPSSAFVYYNTTGSAAAATWGKSGTGFWHGVRMAWRGQSGLGGHLVVTEGTGSTNHLVSDVNPTRPNSRVVSIVATDLTNAAAGPFTPPEGWTERYDATKTSGVENESIAVADIVADPEEG